MTFYIIFRKTSYYIAKEQDFNFQTVINHLKKIGYRKYIALKNPKHFVNQLRSFSNNLKKMGYTKYIALKNFDL